MALSDPQLLRPVESGATVLACAAIGGETLATPCPRWRMESGTTVLAYSPIAGEAIGTSAQWPIEFRPRLEFRLRQRGDSSARFEIRKTVRARAPGAAEFGATRIIWRRG